MKSQTSYKSEKQKRLKNVPVSYKVKMRAIHPVTGMRFADKLEESDDKLKNIITALPKRRWEKFIRYTLITTITLLLSSTFFAIIYYLLRW